MDGSPQQPKAGHPRFEDGGLPERTVARLERLAARQGTPDFMFTSDLSPNEMALTRAAGYEPLGQVMGGSIYRPGVQWRTPNWRDSDIGKAFPYELDVLTEGYRRAMRLALGRLRQEAELLGATGVVGVHIRGKEFRWPHVAEDWLKLTAIGTAIRESARPPRLKDPAGAGPFLSHLSGQDFWALVRSGFRPAALVTGCSIYYSIASTETAWIAGGNFGRGSFQNQELADYTRALYNARSLAMGRMEEEARAARADGIVGVQVEMKAKKQSLETSQGTGMGMLYHFLAIGTAIVSSGRAAPPGPIPQAVFLK